MLKKVAVSAGVAAVLVGSGSAAYAAHAAPAASTSTTTSTTAPGAKTPGAAKAHHKSPFKRAAHAQWVTYSKKTSTSVTHDAIRGVVTAVSPTSVTVKAADSTSETFSVSSATKVHLKGASAATTGSVTGVQVGDRALVVGTGTTSYAATHVIDRGVPKAGAAKADAKSGSTSSSSATATPLQ